MAKNKEEIKKEMKNSCKRCRNYKNIESFPEACEWYEGCLDSFYFASMVHLEVEENNAD